jgi:translation initiation factor 2 gamma subunit (eIF-2gamma)
MRKLVLALALIFTILSCSKSDENSFNNPTGNGSGDFHPPVWIQGTWGGDDVAGGQIRLFRFTANDFISINPSGEQSNQGLINQTRSTGSTVSVVETISATKYKVAMNFPGGKSLIYEFTKIDDKTIKWDRVQTVELKRM